MRRSISIAVVTRIFGGFNSWSPTSGLRYATGSIDTPTLKESNSPVTLRTASLSHIRENECAGRVSGVLRIRASSLSVGRGEVAADEDEAAVARDAWKTW